MRGQFVSQHDKSTAGKMDPRMTMPLQQFGKLETEEGQRNLMLCIDVDRPTEFMLHWWGEGFLGKALLADAREEGDTIELTPRWVYRVDDKGTLQLPRVRTADEERAVKGLRAKLKKVGSVLDGEWTMPDGKKGRITLQPPEPNAPDILKATDCETWDDFKDWANSARVNQRGDWYRGQGCNSFRLTTTLHRLGRTRLERYCADELRQFAVRAEAVLKMRFDMNNPHDYAVVIGLAQHHGLPTPMTDWTASPYIAAFFAFSDAFEARGNRPDSTHVRIFSLSEAFIARSSPSSVVVSHVQPYSCSLTIAPIHNERLYAQQGRFLVTNLADLESYIHFGEKLSQATILRAADVPIACAADALEDLEFMGLTAAAMFPGLDGVARMIKHQMAFRHLPLQVDSRDVLSQSSGTANNPEKEK